MSALCIVCVCVCVCVHVCVHVCVLVSLTRPLRMLVMQYMQRCGGSGLVNETSVCVCMHACMCI